VPPVSLPASKGITIDSLFLRVPVCQILMPFGMCQIDYNIDYGFPQSIRYSWGAWINVNLSESGDGIE
ncbi:MAG: hypothetical protein K8I30_19600, partial [Anaerolineae bacterium]|nr:hypothetical protein [Anaerolineae bacterium]